MKYLLLLSLLIATPVIAKDIDKMSALEYQNRKIEIINKIAIKTMTMTDFKDFKFILNKELSKKPIKIINNNILQSILNLFK